MMNIAIMGIRGIPANYGGFETFTEELSTRLVQRGHRVTVYCRSNIISYDGEFYRGVRLIVLPTISHKYLDTVAHTFLSVWHALLYENFDAILVCNSANSSFCFIPRLKGMPVALNVDGLEWRRKKWNRLGKWFYKVSEMLATVTANEIVTDAKVIQEYYLRKFGKDSTYIPYGAPIGRIESKNVLTKFGLKPGKYVLYVSRLEPENNAHVVVKAFEKVRTDYKCVIVGDAPYNGKYIQELKSTPDPRIIFTGYVFGDGYRELQSNAYFYVQGTEVGGTHPALLEGMGHGNCVVANDVAEHREVLGDAGFYYRKNDVQDLSRKMQFLLDHPNVVREAGEKARSRILNRYTWDKITDRYEELFYRLCGRKPYTHQEEV
jgi:glycosyltransferase involved in cell wall biosynthesis